MSDAAKNISREEVRIKLAKLRQQENPIIDAPSSFVINSDSPYLKAAAVMVFYDPETLQPYGSDITDGIINKDQLIDELVGCSEPITDTVSLKHQESANSGLKTESRVLFRLKDTLRRVILKRLIKDGNATGALHANSKITFDNSNAQQQFLTRCLLLEPIELIKLSADELCAYAKISDWLTDAGKPWLQHSSGEILARMEIIEMLRPFKHLTGVFENGVFTSTFRGRKTELSTLRSYVGVAPPKGALETVNRFISSIASGLFSSEKKPLLIFGIGGVGKSTLLAKFILEHAEAHRADRFPFVYLDFDRPNLSALEPETLLVEAARQLAIQYKDLSDIAELFTSFYAKWSKVYSVLLDSGDSTTITLASTDSAKQRMENRANIQAHFLKNVHELNQRESKPFLIVLDTFEEVQFKGVAYIRQLYEFMQLLQRQFPALRSVIAGRAPVSEFDTMKLELGDLDAEAAEGFLQRQGVEDPALRKLIQERAGGNPLTLKLAVEFVKKNGSEEFRDIKLTQRKLAMFSSRLPELQVQGMLYDRILDHLHNPELKKLAHPGMVLRKITPDIILKILSGPCKLNLTTPEEARKIFNEMSQEVALVNKTDDNTLRHRTDVRKMMLRLINDSDKKELVGVIHQKAIEYYSDKAGLADRAEEVYHRLASGQSPREVESYWHEGMQDYLLGNVDELPQRAQAYLLAKSGVAHEDLSVWENADTEDINRHVIKQSANLLNTGNPTLVLELLEQGISGRGAEILSVLKVRALTQLNRYEEAFNTARQALSSFYANDFAPAVKKELQQFLSNKEKKEEAGDEWKTNNDQDYIPPPEASTSFEV